MKIKNELKNDEVKRLFQELVCYIKDMGALTYKNISEAADFLTESEESDISGLDDSNLCSWFTRTCPRTAESAALLAKAMASCIRLDDCGCVRGKSKSDFFEECRGIFKQYNCSYAWNSLEDSESSYCELISSAVLIAYDNRKQPKAPPTSASTITIDGVVEDEVRRKLEESRKRFKRVAAFDLDGTLLRGVGSSWEILYRAAGADHSGAMSCYKKFKNGEMSYPEWVERDLRDLRSARLKRSALIERARTDCRLMSNIREGIAKLKEAGFAVAIISGGVDTVITALLPDAYKLFDAIYVNEAIFDPITDELIDIIPTPYDWNDDGKLRGVSGKNEGLRRFCAKHTLTPRDAVFVGDSENDFKAMKIAGKSILVVDASADGLVTPAGASLFLGDDFLKLAERILALNS